jgi:hypothetical protein
VADAYEQLRVNHYGISPGIELRSARGRQTLNPRAFRDGAATATGRGARGPMGAAVLSSAPAARVVPSAEGRLSQILLAYPAYADERSSHRAVYADLVAALPATVGYTIVVHESVRADLVSLLSEAGTIERARLLTIPDYLHFLVWTQDPLVALTSQTQSETPGMLLEPIEFPRAADSLLADLLVDAFGFTTDQSPLPLEGGNLLAGDDFVLLGADTLLRTSDVTQRLGHLNVPPGDSLDDLALRILRDSMAPGMEVHLVGTSLPLPAYFRRPTYVAGRPVLEEFFLGIGRTQPIFHLDMFLTLAGRGQNGRYRVLVGDPLLADSILARTPAPNSLACIFDDIAQRLRRLGFEVIRNPLPLTYVDYVDEGVRSWYYATSNNCIVQVDREAGNRVWLPTYGHGDWASLRATDEANASAWAGLGFDVTLLGDYHRFAQNLGSAHCIVNVYRRG